jgi:chromosome segregation ATPase
MLPVMPALPDAPAHRSSRPPEPRISDDQRATLRELARMSDRLVQSREDLATITAHAAQLEASVASSTEQLAAADQRLLASRVLVQDAQRATHELSERCVWLESRCETLQEALELAVNASWITRWSWRREQRARARA